MQGGECSHSDGWAGCMRRLPYLAYSLALRASTLVPSFRRRSSYSRLGHAAEVRILRKLVPLDLAISSAFLPAALAVAWSRDCSHQSACCHHSSMLEGQ